jgi:hypothetical protein
MNRALWPVSPDTRLRAAASLLERAAMWLEAAEMPGTTRTDVLRAMREVRVEAQARAERRPLDNGE